jgi:hypothetical protein
MSGKRSRDYVLPGLGSVRVVFDDALINALEGVDVDTSIAGTIITDSLKTLDPGDAGKLVPFLRLPTIMYDVIVPEAESCWLFTSESLQVMGTPGECFMPIAAAMHFVFGDGTAVVPKTGVMHGVFLRGDLRRALFDSPCLITNSFVYKDATLYPRIFQKTYRLPRLPFSLDGLIEYLGQQASVVTVDVHGRNLHLLDCRTACTAFLTLRYFVNTVATFSFVLTTTARNLTGQDGVLACGPKWCFNNIAAFVRRQGDNDHAWAEPFSRLWEDLCDAQCSYQDLLALEDECAVDVEFEEFVVMKCET